MMTYEMIAALYPIEKDHKGSKAIYQITLERGVVLTIVIGDREDMTEVFNKYIKPKKIEPLDIRPYSYPLSDETGRAPGTILKPSKESSGELSEVAKERLIALGFTSMYPSVMMLDSKDTLDTASKLVELFNERRYKKYTSSDEKEDDE